MMGRKKIVKVSLVPGNADMCRYFSKDFFTDYVFEINNPDCIECDYWIIHYGLPGYSETAKVSSRNVFLITGENEGSYNQKFLSQFQKVITTDTKLQGNNISYGLQGLPWFINESFDNLYKKEYVEKTRLISVVASDKKFVNYTRNYKIRYDFVMALKNYFGNDIDVYGKGFNEIRNKDEGLLPYKFSIAIENMPLPYNISEKLNDCYLTHTFPLYYDCPNIDRFYDERSFARLDIMDHDYSISRIENILTTQNFYEEHLEVTIESKKRYLLNYSFQAIMVKIIEKYGLPDLKTEIVNLKPNNDFRSKLKIKIIDLAYNILR